MKTKTLVALVVGCVLVVLAVFSFYHAHSVLEVLHFRSRDHARAALGGTRRGGGGDANLPSLDGGNAARAAVDSSGADLAGAASVGSRGVVGAGGVSASGAAATLPGSHSPCLGAVPATAADPGGVAAAGQRVGVGDGRKTYMLLNRHMVLGFVGSGSSGGGGGGRNGIGGRLDYFPEVYNVHFTPPPPQTLQSTGGVGMGNKEAPRAAAFTSSAVAPDLFSVVVKVATDKDWVVQRRKDAAELRELKRVQSGAGAYGPIDNSDDSGAYDYVDGGVGAEPAFVPLSMRLRSSAHCRVAAGGSGAGGTDAAADGGDGDGGSGGIDFHPVGAFEDGRVAARFACQFAATLRPNPESGDGNGLALKLPGVARVGHAPRNREGAAEENRRRAAAWAAAPPCRYDITLDVGWEATLGPSDHFVHMDVDLPARVAVAAAPVSSGAANGAHCPAGDGVSAAYHNLFTFQFGTPLGESLVPPSEAQPTDRGDWHNLYTSGPSVEGTPVVDGTSGVFAALESPLSHNLPAPPTVLLGEYVDLYAQHTGAYHAQPGPRWAPWGFCSLPMLPNVMDRAHKDFAVRAAARLHYGTVVGTYADVNGLKRAFTQYLESRRPVHRRPLLHYNSWFDFFTWQEGDGLNEDIEYLSRFDPTNPLLAKLQARKAKVKDRKMNEKSCKARVVSMGTELHEKRGVRLDSFLWDDGWDNHSSLWDFHNGFPHGFTPVSEVAKQYGAGIGVWMSPWGGYGGAKDERIASANKNPQHVEYETNAMGFSLVGKNYYLRFRDIALRMVNDYGVNMFKFDGVAGFSATYAEEMQAMLRLIRDLKEAGEDAFINLTTGTWASPFWLLFCDSIWRGMTDLGLIGEGTARQRWVNYRDAVVYNNVVQRSPMFPISGLMLHGIVAGMVGESHARGLDVIPSTNDFAHEVFTYFGMGTSLQELYFSPEQVTPAAWDVTAHAAKWARARARVLRDSHWIGGDPEERAVYGFASAAPRLGVMTLRNPADVAQPAHFSPASVLLLDAVDTDGFYNYPIIRAWVDPQHQQRRQHTQQQQQQKWSRWEGVPGTVAPRVRVRCVHANPHEYDADVESLVPPEQQVWSAVPGDCLRTRAVIKQIVLPTQQAKHGGAASSDVVDVPLDCVTAAQEQQERADGDEATEVGAWRPRNGYCLLPTWMAMLFLQLAPHEAVVLEFEPDHPRGGRGGGGSGSRLPVFPVRPYDFRLSAAAARQHRAHAEGHHDHPGASDDDDDAIANLPHAAADWARDVVLPASLALRVAAVFEAAFAGAPGQASADTAWDSLQSGLFTRQQSHRHTALVHGHGVAGAALVVSVRASRQTGRPAAPAAPQFAWSAADLERLRHVLCFARRRPWAVGEAGEAGAGQRQGHAPAGNQPAVASLRLRAAFVLVRDQKGADTAAPVGDDRVAWLQLHSLASAVDSPFAAPLSLPGDGADDAAATQVWLDQLLAAYVQKQIDDAQKQLQQQQQQQQRQRPASAAAAADPLANLPVDMLWEVELVLGPAPATR